MDKYVKRKINSLKEEVEIYGLIQEVVLKYKNGKRRLNELGNCMVHLPNQIKLPQIVEYERT